MILYIILILTISGGFFFSPIWIAALFFTIVIIIVQTAHGYGHENDMNNIWQKREDKKIQMHKNQELLDEFKLYLSDMYPKLEKEIIKSMKPGNVNAYMIKYPELKSSKTICKLVDLINSNKSRIYEYETSITSFVRNIQVRVYTAKVWVVVTRKMKNDAAGLLENYKEKIMDK